MSYTLGNSGAYFSHVMIDQYLQSALVAGPASKTTEKFYEDRNNDAEATTQNRDEARNGVPLNGMHSPDQRGDTGGSFEREGQISEGAQCVKEGSPELLFPSGQEGGVTDRIESNMEGILQSTTTDSGTLACPGFQEPVAHDAPPAENPELMDIERAREIPESNEPSDKSIPDAAPSASDGGNTGLVWADQLVSTDVAQLFFTAINKEWKISPNRMRNNRERRDPEISVAEVAARVMSESTANPGSNESMNGLTSYVIVEETDVSHGNAVADSDVRLVADTAAQSNSVESGVPENASSSAQEEMEVLPTTSNGPAVGVVSEMLEDDAMTQSGSVESGIPQIAPSFSQEDMEIQSTTSSGAAGEVASEMLQEGAVGGKRGSSALEEDTSDVAQRPVSWEAKVRGLSHMDCRVVNDVLPLGTMGSPKKKPKLVQKEQVEITQQLNAVRLSCLCEEVTKLGAKGNVDRYSLDVTKAWTDYKGSSKSLWIPEGSKAASTVSVCQAKMSVDNRLYGCMRAIARSFVGNLYRPSPSHPLIALCEIHCAVLRNHNCCPGCGVFCEVGEFRACSQTSGHFYHDACTDTDRIGKIRCPHCLKPSAHVKKTIKNPGLLPVDFGTDLDPQMLLFARRPPFSHVGKPVSTYYRDFPLGFRIACGYLPQSHMQQLKEKLEHLDMGVHEEMEWLDLFQLIKDGDVKGVLQFVCSPGNVQNLYRECVLRQKNETELLSHFPLSGPVHLAVQRNQPVILSILLQVGFPMDLPDKAGVLSFEQAALADSYLCLDLLKKFYTELPPSAVRELSLRRLLGQEQYSSVALLFRYAFYDFGEFSFSKEEQEEAVKNLFCCGSITVISNLVECQHIVDQLRYGSFGSELLGVLMKNWRHRFAVSALHRLGIRLLDNVPESFDDGAVGRRMLAASTGGALPAVGISKFFDGADDAVLVPDLSNGREMHRVEVANRFDQTLPMPFTYVTQRVVERDKSWNIGLQPKKAPCVCLGGCAQQCFCISAYTTKADWNNLYTKDRLLDMDRYRGETLYECNRLCRCPPNDCQNRVVQYPSAGFFQVYKTRDRSWGLRSKYPLPKGFFVGRTTGSLAHMGTVNDVLKPGEGELQFVQSVSAERDKQVTGIITRDCGNYTRFVKKEAVGNLVAVQVYTENDVGDVPQIALFTKDLVGAFQPLVLETGQTDVTQWTHVVSENRYKK